MAQPKAPTTLDKLKSYVSPNSAAGKLRDQKKKTDAEINKQTSSRTVKSKNKLA